MFTSGALKAFHDRYRRLAKDRLGLSSLWLGEDHLVHVKGKGLLLPFSEEYRRFRLSDIQAICVAKTSRLGLALLLAGVVLCGGVPAALILLLATVQTPESIVFACLFLLIALVGAGLLLRHLVLGPTCICELQTRMVRERLRPLNRYHFALETVRRIEELIRERQEAPVGGAEDDAGTRLVALPRTEPAGFYAVPPSSTASFGSFAALGLVALAAIHLESLPLVGVALLLVLGASIALIVALVASVRKATPESIRAALWTLLGLDFVVIGVGSVYYFVVSAADPAYTIGITGPLEAFAAIAEEGGVILYGVVVALLGSLVAAAGAGLGLAAKWRSRMRLAAEMAPSQPMEKTTPPSDAEREEAGS